MNESVSVIIPSYNGHNLITRAVESVLNQSYKNIELIVVDDNGEGSSEQVLTEEVLKEYISDKLVKYCVHKVNKNGSAARNTGAANSSGKYLVFLDDDDILTPDAIQNHVDVLSETGPDVGMSYCGFRIKREGFKDMVYTSKLEGSVLYDFLTRRIAVGSSWMMVKREAFDAVCGFDESFKRHQDWEFIARVLSKYKLAAVKKVGVIKYDIFRNNPEKPELAEKYDLYFLEKMQPIIEGFLKRKQCRIFDVHYFSLSKRYFKAKNLKKSLFWFGKIRNKLLYFFKFIRDSLGYLLRKLLK